MQKRILAAVTAMCVVFLSGCRFFVGDVDAMAPEGATAVFDGGSWTYYYGEPQYSLELEIPESEGAALTQPTPPEPSVPVSGVPSGSDPAPSAVSPDVTSPAPTDPPAVTEQPTSGGEVDLGIRMPTPNGTMVVTHSAEHPLIRTVHEQRGIDVSLLTAVYAEPKSGQNYVFEFYSAGDRSADGVRRVYYLTDDNVITSVAADRMSEIENLTLLENWMCLEWLIKGTVFPALKDQM